VCGGGETFRLVYIVVHTSVHPTPSGARPAQSSIDRPCKVERTGAGDRSADRGRGDGRTKKESEPCHAREPITSSKTQRGPMRSGRGDGPMARSRSRPKATEKRPKRGPIGSAPREVGIHIIVDSRLSGLLILRHMSYLLPYLSRRAPDWAASCRDRKPLERDRGTVVSFRDLFRRLNRGLTKC